MTTRVREIARPAAGRVRMAAPEPVVTRTTPAAELGRRIKMLRVGRGLTLKDLEERGGISATHISEIERGKASPTVGALGKIAAALGLRPAMLVAGRPVPAVCLRRSGESSAPPVQWGGASIESLTCPSHESGIGLHRFTLPIARDPLLQHRHDGEEWVTVLSGVAEVRVEDRPFVLREGDSLHFHASRTHGYSNLGSSPATLLVAGRPRLTL